MTHPEVLVDQIGYLRAEIAPLAEELKKLEAELKACGEGKYTGEYYDVTVYTSERDTVAWKKIAEKLGASRQIISGNTKHSTSVGLRSTARAK